MSECLLLDFDAFFLEHRLCGQLDAGETPWRAVQRAAWAALADGR